MIIIFWDCISEPDSRHICCWQTCFSPPFLLCVNNANVKMGRWCEMVWRFSHQGRCHLLRFTNPIEDPFESIIICWWFNICCTNYQESPQKKTVKVRILFQLVHCTLGQQIYLSCWVDGRLRVSVSSSSRTLSWPWN